jgi:hypothetical protein
MELLESEIQDKIKKLEQELDIYQKDQQKKIEEIMFRTGITTYLAGVNVQVARLQGQIEILKSLIVKDEQKTQ